MGKESAEMIDWKKFPEETPARFGSYLVYAPRSLEQIYITLWANKYESNEMEFFIDNGITHWAHLNVPEGNQCS
jgi:hypothetical protein